MDIVSAIQFKHPRPISYAQTLPTKLTTFPPQTRQWLLTDCTTTMNPLNLAIVAMIVALLIPLYQAWRDEDIWQTMLALSSVAAKAAVIILAVSVLEDDWMMGVVGVLILSVGNAGFMLLAYILQRMNAS